MQGIKWFHQIDLGNGIITPGVDPTAKKLETIGLPQDLTGKSVLDIGAWDGFFSFEAERRGASRVVAVDSFSWSGPGWGSKDGFLLAREALRLGQPGGYSKVEDHECEVLDLDPTVIGRFDLVLFLGVLYHMPHPYLALEKVAAVTRGQLILETHVDLTHLRRPAIAFYPGGELSEDPTNWCGPNPAAVEAMLKTLGFREVRSVWRNYGVTAAADAFKEEGLHAAPGVARTLVMPPGKIRSRRAVFHAWK